MSSDLVSVLDSIGAGLKRARERAGYTLEQVAESTGLSKAHLSRLESAERQPSISALLELSAALRVPVSTLLGEDETAAPLSIHGGAEPRHDAAGLSITACSGYAGSTDLEALRITVPADRAPTDPASHRGEEWLYVTSGTLRLEYDGDVHLLDAGMCAHFDAQVPHRLGAEGGVAEVLLVAANRSRSILDVHR